MVSKSRTESKADGIDERNRNSQQCNNRNKFLTVFLFKAAWRKGTFAIRLGELYINPSSKEVFILSKKLKIPWTSTCPWNNNELESSGWEGNWTDDPVVCDDLWGIVAKTKMSKFDLTVQETTCYSHIDNRLDALGVLWFRMIVFEALQIMFWAEVVNGGLATSVW